MRISNFSGFAGSWFAVKCPSGCRTRFLGGGPCCGAVRVCPKPEETNISKTKRILISPSLVAEGHLRVNEMPGIIRVFDPHPALRATLSQWEREWLEDCPSPTGRGWREAPGEGRKTVGPKFLVCRPPRQLSSHTFADRGEIAAEDILADIRMRVSGFTRLQRAHLVVLLIV